MRSERGVTRRRFLSAAGAAIAAPVMIPRRVLGYGAAASAGNQVTMGFIGMGRMNLGHLGWFLGQGDCRVLAVCDVDTTRREHARQRVDERYGAGGKGCWATSDCNELIARKDIDAVVIATPDHWHTIAILGACKAHKDVYCEKPLTLTIHEAKSAIDAVRKYDIVFQTGSQQRSDREFRHACELVRSGRIGKLLHVYAAVGGPSQWCDLPEEAMEPGLEWDRWLGPAPKRPYNSVLSPRGVHGHFPNWRNYREYSGGMMTDWGAHHFDIAQWGIGADGSGPVEIIPPEGGGNSGVRYVYAGGVDLIHGGYKGRGGVNFVGTDGEIFVDRGRLQSWPESIIKEEVGDDGVRLYRSPGHQRDWLNCVRSRKRPICDVEIGAGSVTVCHLGNLAYWNRRSLKWDPAKWEFVDDKEANGWRDYERRGKYALPEV